MSERGHELIARVLSEQGLDARSEEGWVYVYLPDGSRLEIAAENGASLDASIYQPRASAVSADRATKPEPPAPPSRADGQQP